MQRGRERRVRRCACARTTDLARPAPPRRPHPAQRGQPRKASSTLIGWELAHALQISVRERRSHDCEKDHTNERNGGIAGRLLRLRRAAAPYALSPRASCRSPPEATPQGGRHSSRTPQAGGRARASGRARKSPSSTPPRPRSRLITSRGTAAGLLHGPWPSPIARRLQSVRLEVTAGHAAHGLDVEAVAPDIPARWLRSSSLAIRHSRCSPTACAGVSVQRLRGARARWVSAAASA